jgi:SRSO17 transposase
LKTLPEESWERLSAGEGSKGERYYDWLSLPINSPEKENWKCCLLIRRSIIKADELRAFICFYPEETSLKKLAEVSGIRWTVEQSFKESKGEVGLDQYEVRSFNGWYKHITLACLAHALLTVLKKEAEAPEFQKALEPESCGNSSLEGFKKGRNL